MRSSIARRSSSAEGGRAKRSWTGRGVAAVMVSRRSSAVRRPRVPIDQRRRASEMGERSAAEGEALGERRGRQVDGAQQLARPQDVRVVAGDEIDAGTLRGAAVARPERADRPRAPTASEIMAPAGSDMQMLPPTVAAFQILNEASRDVAAFAAAAAPRVHSAGAREAIELGDAAGGGDVEPGRGRLQRRPAEAFEIDQRVGAELRLGEQPGAAGEPGIAVAPWPDLVRRGRVASPRRWC